VSSPSVHSQRDIWRRRLALGLGLGAVLGGIAASPLADYAGRLGIDLLLPQRDALYGPLRAPQDSPVVAVVIDEQSYRTEPFRDTPRVAWTPYLAGILSLVDGVGASAIGLDIIHPTSLDRPDLLADYDKPYRKALRRVGEKGNLVMGQVRLSGETISPYAGLVQAVGGWDNVRLLNLLVDSDNVIRRYPGGWEAEDGSRVSSFAVELARRAGSDVPDENILINYDTGPGDIPAYSFADLWACAQARDADYFRSAFAGKIVLIGLALDLEDRSLTAKRFATAEHNTWQQPRCALEADPERFGAIVDRRTIPGIYVHAAAINTLIAGNAPAMLPRGGVFALVGLATALLFLAFTALSPLAGFGVLSAFIAGSDLLSVLALHHLSIAPLLALMAAAAIAYAAAYAYRFVVEDRARRWVKHAFQHFLAPEMVERLTSDPEALRLGGEARTVAIFFSDIEGFTTLSEALKDDPEKLVDILNAYLTLMTDAVEANGGYVDKYIGDAVMAVWGAPLGDEQMSHNAIHAALDCQQALTRFNEEVLERTYGLQGINTRIGINTGIAVVGNMGSERRLNYTLTGDSVNLAARLEGANKQFGTRLMIGENTARAVRDTFLLRRLDRLVVKGKTQPVRVYEVLCRHENAGAAHHEQVAAFHEALALYYRGRFAEAAEAFEALAESDSAAILYVERCRHYHDNPPARPWNRAFEMKTK